MTIARSCLVLGVLTFFTTTKLSIAESASCGCDTQELEVPECHTNPDPVLDLCSCNDKIVVRWSFCGSSYDDRIALYAYDEAGEYKYLPITFQFTCGVFPCNPFATPLEEPPIHGVTIFSKDSVLPDSIIYQQWPFEAGRYTAIYQQYDITGEDGLGYSSQLVSDEFSWPPPMARSTSTFCSEKCSQFEERTFQDKEGLLEAIRNFDPSDSAAIPIDCWDVREVQDLSYLFNDTNFNSPIGCWDMSQVRNTKYMFNDARLFNQDIGFWNMERVSNAFRMFRNAESFNHDISGWNTTALKNTWQMFWGAKSFNQDISGWNVEAVVTFREMFQDAESFNQNLCRWWENGLEDARSFLGMFENSGCPIMSDPDDLAVCKICFTDR